MTTLAAEQRSPTLVPQLSATEGRIVRLLTEGWSRREVAADIGLDEQTVAWHVAQAMRKLERASALSDRIRRAISSSPGEETDLAAGKEEQGTLSTDQ